MSSSRILWLMPLFLLASCAHSNNGDNYAIEKAENDTNDSVMLNMATAPLSSQKRKIIHTADFTCTVSDVFAATEKLEHIVRASSGIVQESHIINHSSETKRSYYSTDSLRETNTYTTTASLTLRVPANCIDSVVALLPSMCTFIQSRVLKQNDVTHRYIANILKNRSENVSSTHLTIQTARNRDDATRTELYDVYGKERKIDRQIENLDLDDNISFATLTVEFTQPEAVHSQIIINTDHITKTPFVLQSKAAFNSGWELIKSLMILFLKTWPVIVLAGITAYGIKRNRKRLRVTHK